MAILNDPKFMVYTKGYHPDQLCLGHLVLGPYYHDPVDQISRRCQFPRLTEAECKEWVNVSDWSGRCIAKKGGNFGFGVEAIELVNLSPSVDWTGSKILEAEKGRRIELKEPQKFLTEKVLASPQAEETLKRWLSIARTNYMFHQFLRRRPKIWMLTALYELEKVKVELIKERNLSLSLGASSTFIGTLSGVPVGASVSAGLDVEGNTVSRVEQPMVYAARYQLLEARYVSSKITPEPHGIQLHRDNIYSRGFAMGGEQASNEARKADSALVKCTEPGADDFVEGDEEELTYWNEFAKAEQMLMKRVQQETSKK